MAKATLVILNPNAAGGRAGRLWPQLEPVMYRVLGDLVVAITEYPAEVGRHLDKAREPRVPSTFGRFRDASDGSRVTRKIRR